MNLTFTFSDGPSVVKLMLRSKSLSAGKSHEIRCEAIGAKPQASISWWVGGKEVNYKIKYNKKAKLYYINTLA